MASKEAQDDDLPSAPQIDELHAAACRVAAAWNGDGGSPVDQQELLRHLDAVVAATECGEPTSDALSPGDLALRRHLVDLVRAELVHGWAQPSQDAPDADGMLKLLQGLESVRAGLGARTSDGLAAMFSQTDALELVVEVAHDLRSPLTSILFLADPLRRGQSGEVNQLQRQQLGIIYSAALGLLSVASDVIEMAQGGDRLSDQELVPFSVSEVLQSVRDMVQPVAEQKGLTLRLLPVDPDYRMGYSVALSRVLLNLASNALKFTDEGVVEIVARNSGQPSRVEFSVRDTGDGIDPEVQKDLFRPFRSVRRRSGYAFSETGLGLFICRKLIHAMGSELQLETAKDWGTRFYFELELPVYTSPIA